MLNLWIGLCRGVPGLPTSIHRLGYKDGYIEEKIHSGNGKICNPELIAHSAATGHTLLFEWKTGPNLEDDQLARYRDLTAAHVQGAN